MPDFSNAKTKLALVAIALTSLAGFLSAPSYAWSNCNHARRAEVLNRDNNLRGRIAQDPYLSPGERMRLGAEDRAIRTQEQIDAFRHGGHITRSEQYRLNTEENRLRHQIYRDSRY